MDAQSPDDPPRPSAWRRSLWALGPLVLAGVAVELSYTHTANDGQTIVEPAPWVGRSLGVLALGWFLGLGVLGVATGGRRGPGALALAFAALLGVVLSCGNAFLLRTARWEAVPGSATTPSGTTWRAFTRGFMDQDFAFATLASRGAAATRWETVSIVSPNEDQGVRIVRPAGLDPDRIIVVRNGRAALLYGDDGRCDAAIALDGTPVIGQRAVGDTWEIAGPKLPDGLPVAFLLIEPGDTPLAADVERLAAAITADVADPQPWSRALPTDDGLAAALDSAHPGIRAAAERLARAGGAKLYPKAASRLLR